MMGIGLRLARTGSVLLMLSAGSASLALAQYMPMAADPAVEPPMMEARVPSAETEPPSTSAQDTPPSIAPPPISAPDIMVSETTLLSVVTDSAGMETITPTNAIPYIVERSCYNWGVKFDRVEGDLILTEELQLPGPARNWNEEGTATQVNAQRSGAITQRHFDAAKGMAMAGWCVAKDDPVGSYRYIIRQGEREVARFDFTVGDLL